MIPILYEARTMFYGTNGLGGLPHAISCTVTEERNGQYYLEMEYPASGLHGSELGVDRIIYAAPAPKKRPQPFVIERIEQDIDGILKIYAPHISRLLTKRVANVQAINDSITSPRGAAATMRIILNNSTPSNSDFPVFTTESHMNNALKSIHVSGVVIPAMSCLMGARGSVLDVFGGEFEFDETNIILWLNRGTETGLEIRYGANMSKLEAETDAADLITACVPFWSSGEETVVGDQCSADTAGNFSFVRCAPLDVTETLGTDAVPTVAEVAAAGQAYIDATESKNLSTSIDVEAPPVAIVPFNVQPPPDRSVYLCDTVTVVHPGLQLKQTAKIVACVFNVLTEQYNSVTVGQLRRDISDTIAGLVDVSSETQDTTTAAEKDAAAELQALRRKMLGATRVLRTAFKTGQTVNAATFELPLASDANAVVTDESIQFARYNGNTLNTPYKQGISSWQQGMIASFSNGNAWQLAAPIGAAAVFIRSGSYSGGTITFNSWLRLLTTNDLGG